MHAQSSSYRAVSRHSRAPQQTYAAVLHLDQENAQVRLIERDDGRIELVPVVAVRADQAWFWTDRWQTMELEADADVAAGRTVVVDGSAA